VGPGELAALQRAFREPGVLSGLKGEALSPAILGEEARREVWRIGGDRGAKGLLLNLGARVVELGPGPWSLDADTWEAYVPTGADPGLDPPPPCSSPAGPTLPGPPSAEPPFPNTGLTRC
jgi:hypothetical protein